MTEVPEPLEMKGAGQAPGLTTPASKRSRAWAILDGDAGAMWGHEGLEGSSTECRRGVAGLEEEPGG